MFNEIRNRANEVALKIQNDNTKTIAEKEFANNVVLLFNNYNNINRLSESTIFAIFRFLGYKSETNSIQLYSKMYDKLKMEINKEYKYIDINDLARGNNGKVF